MKLWRWQEALEMVKGCCGGSRRLWRQLVRSFEDGRKLWRSQEALEAVELLCVGIIEELAQVDDTATIACDQHHHQHHLATGIIINTISRLAASRFMLRRVDPAQRTHKWHRTLVHPLGSVEAQRASLYLVTAS